MTDDIVPHLLEQLRANIEANQETSAKLRELLLKLRAKEADYIDAHAFAVEAGEIAAQAFKDVITPDALPDGRVYYNIGNRLLTSILGERHELISSYAAKVQTDLNKKAGIHLKAQVPELNTDRIKGLVNRLDREAHFEDVAWILDSPVVGFCMNVVDTSIDKNIQFQYRAGLHPKLTRSLEDGKACKWCRNLAGTYRYPDEVPDMVYHRHNNCRCTTYFYPGDGKRQDVWSKTVEKASKRDIIKPKVKVVASGAKNYEREIIYDYLKNPEKIQEEKFAYRMYDTIKNSNQEIEKRKIYSNIRRFSITKDFSKNDVDIAFTHVFNDLHDLEDGRGLFKPDFDMAHSWNRLINHEDKILEHDLLMLLHERLEHDLMYVVNNLDYDTAHTLTNKLYNYEEALRKWKKGE